MGLVNRPGQMKCSGLPGWKGADLALCICPTPVGASLLAKTPSALQLASPINRSVIVSHPRPRRFGLLGS